MTVGVSSPEAQGTLAEWPLPALFAHVVEESLSGSLVVRFGTSSHVVIFKDGKISALWSSRGARGGDDASIQLATLARLPPEATYEFHNEEDLLEPASMAEARVKFHTLAAILALSREWPDDARMESEIEQMVGDQPLVLDTRSDLSQLALEESENGVIALLRTSPLSWSALRESADEHVARPLIYALAITRHFAHDSGPPLSLRNKRAPSEKPSMMRSVLPAESRSEVRRMLAAAERHSRALAAHQGGDDALAESLAIEAVELDPHAIEHSALLGYVRAMRGESAALLDEAIERDPRDDRFFLYRARVREKRGEAALAHADYARAVELNPDNREARAALESRRGLSPLILLGIAFVVLMVIWFLQR
jgi:tetratricopeptide (TPR) repeat protein